MLFQLRGLMSLNLTGVSRLLFSWCCVTEAGLDPEAARIQAPALQKGRDSWVEAGDPLG